MNPELLSEKRLLVFLQVTSPKSFPGKGLGKSFSKKTAWLVASAALRRLGVLARLLLGFDVATAWALVHALHIVGFEFACVAKDNVAKGTARQVLALLFNDIANFAVDTLKPLTE